MEEATVKKNKYEMDMCSGALLPKILLYSLPLMLSGVLQLLFNAADIVVVGRFAGHDALAAVGSTSSLINLLVNVFMGLSVGTNVMVARFYGAGQKKELEEMVHTAILTSLVSGAALIFVGLALSRPALLLMDTPEDVIGQSVLYIRIYFVGMPAMMLYNFGSAVLRAVGDTRRPLYFLMIAGVINVVLNLIFVIPLSMGVAGVALATIISQTISAALVLICLTRTRSDYQVCLKKLRIVKDKMFKMIGIGLPAGLQGALFSVSNVLIQSSVNSFQSVAMAGNTASANIEGFVYTAMNAVYQTALSFTSQNFGARNYKRMTRILWYCQGLVIFVGVVMGGGAVLLGPWLLGIYSSDALVIQYGMNRLRIISGPYFLCGIMEVMVGGLRGMGCSLLPMFVALTGACVFRVVWIYTVFAISPTLPTLYISYPVSWTITFLAHLACYVMVRRKMERG